MKSPWYAGRGEQYATGIGTSVTGAVSGLWRYENAGAEYGVPRPKATLPPVSDGGMPFITQGVLHVIDATGVLAGKPSCRLEGPVGEVFPRVCVMRNFYALARPHAVNGISLFGRSPIKPSRQKQAHSFMSHPLASARASASRRAVPLGASFFML